MNKKIFMVLVMVVVMGCVDVFGQKFYNPVFYNGFQWELEGGAGASLAVSYKFAKRFSIGVGYQYGISINGYLNQQNRSVTTQYNYSASYEKYFPEDKFPRTIYRSDDWKDGMNGPVQRQEQKYFVNFQIRPVNWVLSPIVGVNVGQMTINLDDYWYPYFGDKQSMLTLTPYVGLSIRMAKNFLLGIKVGVDNLGSKITPNGTMVEEKNIFYTYIPGTNIYVAERYLGKEITTTEFPEVDLSDVYLGLNFTHTMNFGHGYTERRRIAEYRASHPKVKKEHDGHVLDAIAGVLEVTSNALEETSKSLNQMNNTSSGNTYVGNTTSGTYSDQQLQELVRNRYQELERNRYKGADKNIPRFVPEKYDTKREESDATVYESKDEHGQTVVRVSNSCSSCNGSGICSKCGGYGGALRNDIIYYCSYCKVTGRCPNCDGRGYAILTSIHRHDGSWANYPHSTLYEGPHEDFEYEQASTERERNGDMTDHEKAEAEIREMDKAFDEYERKRQQLDNMINHRDIYGYDDNDRKRYQREMKSLRQQHPELEKVKSPLEDWEP